MTGLGSPAVPEPTTLARFLHHRVEQDPDGVALVLPDERVTFAELEQRARFYARALVGLGIGPGETVGILMPALVDFVAAMFGATMVGAVPVLMNARFKAAELRHVVVNGDLTIVLTAASVDDAVDFPALLVEAFPTVIGGDTEGPLEVDGAPRLRRLALIDDEPRSGFLGRAQLDAAAATVDPTEIESRSAQSAPDDVALIMYTSGTTSSPKGAMLTHAGLTRQAELVAETRFQLRVDDVLWTPLPMFHIGGFGYILIAMAAGATIVHAGHFDADSALRQLVEHQVTVALPAFETMWLQVLGHPAFDPADLVSLRLVLAVGVPERLRMMQERLPDAPMVTTFGGTESTSHLSIALPDDPPETRLSTGGHPLPGIEVRIVDTETGSDLAADTPGEILYRGWNRFVGYYNEPELTAEAIDDDGWFHSGDIGALDTDGRLSFVGRLKDMLKVGGENVAAAEIEGFLVAHEAVHIVQVVSAPDDRYTEVPAAFVQLAPGATVTEQDLIDYCRGSIATFKVPRYVRFVDDWPMSGTKIKKYLLRQRIADELAERGVAEAPRITSSR